MPGDPGLNSAVLATLEVMRRGGFDYALIGGLAVALSGHDRLTQDVDVLIWDLDERLEEFRGLLDEAGFRVVSDDALGQARATRLLHTVWGSGVQVDFMLGMVPFEREALDRARTVEVGDGVRVNVADPEDLVIMKLIASRPQDIADVLALRELYPGMDIGRIRAVVSDFAEALEMPEMLESMDRLLG